MVFFKENWRGFLAILWTFWDFWIGHFVAYGIFTSAKMDISWISQIYVEFTVVNCVRDIFENIDFNCSYSVA